MDFNANQYSDVYSDLGIEINKLGCIMLDVEPFSVASFVPGGADDLYYAKDASRFWIKGAVAETTAHATLLFGLTIGSGWQLKPYVDRVLAGWTPPQLQIESVGSFPSPFEDEPYACIVAHIAPSPELLEGHTRLELLPHINTYPQYKPHVTLAYVNKEAEQKWLDTLSAIDWSQNKLDVKAINYGGNK